MAPRTQSATIQPTVLHPELCSSFLRTIFCTALHSPPRPSFSLLFHPTCNVTEWFFLDFELFSLGRSSVKVLIFWNVGAVIRAPTEQPTRTPSSQSTLNATARGPPLSQVSSSTSVALRTETSLQLESPRQIPQPPPQQQQQPSSRVFSKTGPRRITASSLRREPNTLAYSHAHTNSAAGLSSTTVAVFVCFLKKYIYILSSFFIFHTTQ